MRDDCPTCSGTKDVRSNQCRSCQFKYNHPRETGEWGLTASGYLEKQINGVKYYQHRYVMEQHLGRPLSKDEVVHHINGDRIDNRLENLELTTQHEHGKHHAAERDMSALAMKGAIARWGK